MKIDTNNSNNSELETVLPYLKLKFNLKHAELDECYAFGYESAIAKEDENANPFPKGSIESQYWEDGWWAGFYGEPSLYEIHNKEESHIDTSANDNIFNEYKTVLIEKWLSITGIVATSIMLGYQILDFVA